MSAPVSTHAIDDATRERVVVLVCACAAMAWGVVAAAASGGLVIALFIIALFGALAFILPRAWLGVALVVLIPLQFYFPLTESFYLRGALVFVAAAALRVLVTRLAVSRQPSAISGGRSFAWAIPAALFVIAATLAAFGAANRYAALKGIYDWLPIFAAAFVVGETTRGQWRARLPIVLVIVGVAEAMLGWVQTWFTPDQIAELLQGGASQWLYQPNLVRERLTDFSFNWVLGNRVLPFGTFINGIDYAIFLAAIAGLGIALLTADRSTEYAIRNTLHVSRFAFYVLALALIGLALLQTLKGSGLIALAGAGAVWVWVYGARLRAVQVSLVAMIGLGALLLLGAIFFEPLVQRGAFLLQSETGESYETGRLEIWGQLFAALPQRPLFGFGLNNAGQLIAPTQSLRGGAFIANTNSPESAYVATLVETGIVGFAFLAWFIGAILARAFRRARDSTREVGVLAAIVALWCGNLTVSALTTDQNGLLLGVLIGMVFANDARAQE